MHFLRQKNNIIFEDNLSLKSVEKNKKRHSEFINKHINNNDNIENESDIIAENNDFNNFENNNNHYGHDSRR